MNESRSINELNAVGPGVIYDNEPQTDMMLDDGPTEAPMDEERVGYELREGLAPQEAQALVGGTYSPRTVVIEPMHYGYVVKLDCHNFAFESADRALNYVTEYLKDPQGTEKKWWNKELFK